MPQLLRLQSIILVLGNTSCTAAHWMWIIFHGVMHYYAGFNYRIIDWSFPQNSDLIYFDSKYLQNWLWHNHEISMLVWSIWPEERFAWLKKFIFSGCILWVNALLHFFFADLCLPIPLEDGGNKENPSCWINCLVFGIWRILCVCLVFHANINAQVITGAHRLS